MRSAINLKPQISEKAYAQSKLTNTYVFMVPMTSNKHDIAIAVAEQYKVKVTKVNVLLTNNKEVKSMITKRVSKIGNRQILKKAYVTLLAGDTLPFFVEQTEGGAK
jgi:ribosomal protein L23